MAVDSRDKRFSLIGFGFGAFKQVFPNPDGSNWDTASERAHGGLWLYSGIALSAEEPFDNAGAWFVLDRRRDRHPWSRGYR